MTTFRSDLSFQIDSVHAELLLQLVEEVQPEEVQPLAQGQLEEELQVLDVDPDLMQSSILSQCL